MTAAAVPSSAPGLGELLGVHGPSIAWGRVLAFSVAWMFCDLPSILFSTLRHGNFLPPSYWAVESFSTLLLTALLLVSLRNVRGDVGAVLLAAIAYALLVPVVRLLSGTVPGFRSFALLAAVVPYFGPFFVLLGLALALRQLRPQWLALWVGSLAGFTLSYLFGWLWSAAYLLRAHAPNLLSGLSPEAMITNLVTATIFVLIYEGLSSLLG